MGQARNEALKLASGELVDFLDSDDLFAKNKLEKLVPFFEDEKVGLALTNTTISGEDHNGEKIERLMYPTPISEGDVFVDLLRHYNLSFVATMFRKSAIGTKFQ